LRKVKWGVLGVAKIGVEKVIPAMQLGEVSEITAIASRDLGKAKAAADMLGIARAYGSYEDLLADPDIEAVYNPLPNELHVPWTLRALEAGKHVLCEKPIAAVPADAEAMRAAAAEAGTVLAVVANYLFFPEIVALRAIIDSGELGEIRTVRVDMLGVVDSPGAAGYKPTWRHDPAASGGGVLVDMLHGVYLSEFLLGARAERVSAYVDSATDGDAVEGLALCRLEAGRRVAMVNIGWGMGGGGIAVHGTAGRAIAHYRADGTMPWAPFESLTVTTGSPDGDLTRTVDLPAGAELEPLIATAMRENVVDFADAITTGRAPAEDADAALHILQITLAAYASATLGTTVPLPLPVDGPLFTRGVTGLAELDLPTDSFPRRRGLFGLTPAPSTTSIGV
jgi:predicted dehydrogenase